MGMHSGYHLTHFPEDAIPVECLRFLTLFAT